MTTEQPEALQLADDLDAEAGRITQYTNSRGDLLRELAAAELRRQHAEIETLRAGYDAARLEIESLKERVQQLGQLARDVNSRRVTELEAQLAAVGAGGVEPLRKRCLPQISEPAAPPAYAPVARHASQRDELLQVALDFIGTLTGTSPPPIEVAPPEVFAPFYAFVDRVQAITAPQAQPATAQKESND